MISTDEAIRIQSVLIEKFGGTDGLRDKNLLESALMRPYQTFDNKDLYPTPSEKAAAIIESVLINHPFIDGNKRFGYVAMRLTLMDYGLDIHTNEDDKYDFVIKIAIGDFKFDQILNWINDKLK
ncbi:MAG: type II toxin-antitoxin system death-on-curing family toxin [Salinivirgaceae bacterium]|jgi:death-on-curing protein